MLGECPRMQELVRDGTVVQDANMRKFAMADGQRIFQQGNETIADAAS